MRPLAVALALSCLAIPAAAQAPTGPPPPGSGHGSAGAEYHELLPGIGLIGAQVGILVGGSWNPYQVGQGFQVGGYVDLPLADAPGGKLSYELFVGLSSATSPAFTITDQIAFVANLATGATREAALAGPPAAPFPVRRQVRSRLRLLQLSPFGLKYALRRFNAGRVRPYLGAGLDVAVTVTNQDPVADESLEFRGGAPFDAPLIGGTVAQAPELAARGYPTGQGNIDLGFHAVAGIEARIARRVSLNAEYRFTSIGSGDRLQAVTAALGLHW